MSKKKKPKMISIRFRLDKSLLDRIDQIAGERGRQRYIRDAIVWRLDEELPPVMYDMVQEVQDLLAIFHGEGQAPRTGQGGALFLFRKLMAT